MIVSSGWTTSTCIVEAASDVYAIRMPGAEILVDGGRLRLAVLSLIEKAARTAAGGWVMPALT
ncbi:MAG: hypothetical protein Q8O25_10955 [Sulfurisoma sp.]|nr:hypothetical protein [Sulfurisoma sp.]